MKKIILISLTAILVLLSVGYYGFKLVEPDKQEEVEVKEVVSAEEQPAIQIKEENKEPVEDEFPLDMTEEAVQNAIHSMSHQKVIAEDKWGFLPLTQDRVNRLIEIVKHNEGNYSEAVLYLAILERWSENDFSQADEDHNEIWNLQGGTVGEATGVMSVTEEKAFIEEHFDIEKE